MSFRRTLNKALRAHSPTAAPELAIVGLGNPGPEYDRTRHNAGFWCIDIIARKHGIPLARHNRTVIIGSGGIDGHAVSLVKPRTYVNRSGAAIRYLQARYTLATERLLLIYDDINLPPGKIRIRPKGSAGGHNGVKSVIEAVGSQDFPRIRIGVGKPPNGAGQVEHVIGTLPPDEHEVIAAAASRAADAVACLLEQGINAAMSQFN